MSENIRILSLFYRHHPGGTCKRLYLSLEGLLQRGYEVHHICVDELEFSEHPKLFVHKVPYPFKARRGVTFWTLFTILSVLWTVKITFLRRFDAIVIFDPYYGAVAKLAAILKDLPIVLFLRSIPSRRDPLYRKLITGRFSYYFASLGLRCANRVITATDSMRERLIAAIPSLENKAITAAVPAIFPIGVDFHNPEDWQSWLTEFEERKSYVEESHSIPANCIVMMVSGELTERKNVELIIKAINASHNQSLALIVSGKGQEKKRLETLTAGFGLHDQIVISGWVDDFSEVIAGCDLFVMPSRFEGISNSMLEALGSGIGVIAADTPEMREVLRYDELLFDPEDVDKLSKKLEELADNRELLARIIELSRQRARDLNFDWGDGVIRAISY